MTMRVKYEKIARLLHDRGIFVKRDPSEAFRGGSFGWMTIRAEESCVEGRQTLLSTDEIRGWVSSAQDGVGEPTFSLTTRIGVRAEFGETEITAEYEISVRVEYLSV